MRTDWNKIQTPNSDRTTEQIPHIYSLACRRFSNMAAKALSSWKFVMSFPVDTSYQPA